MEVSKSLFFSSKFPWAREMFSSKFIAYLTTCPLKVSLTLP